MGEFEDSQQGASGLGGRDADEGCAVCHDGNWVHVRYEYTDGSPVTDAIYVVQKPNDGKPGGDIIAEGAVTVSERSAHDYVHVDLGDYDGEVEVYFYDDPEDVIPYEEPNPVPDDRAWWEKAVDATVDGLRAAGDWAGGTLMGDWNEDMSTSQIIANTVLTMVPGIDQVGDIRDLAANAYKLIWEERWNDKWVWVGVIACLIGLIPTLGSLAKGIIRLTIRNLGNIGEILVLINRCASKLGFKINGVSKIKEVAEQVVARSGQMVADFSKFLDDVNAKVQASLGWFSRGKAAQIAAKIERAKALAAEKIPESAKYIHDLLMNGLVRAASTVVRGRNRAAITVQRITTRVLRSRRYESWAEIAGDAKRVDYKPDIDDLGSVPASSVAVIRADDIARRQANLRRIKAEIDAVPDHPWKSYGYSDRDLLEQIAKYSGSPRVRNFEDEPMTLYRVVAKEHSSGGDFWSPTAPPSSEAAWRSRDAVLQNWNEGGAYVVMRAPPPKYGLVGEVGPQISENNAELALRGGGQQVWFPKTKGPVDGKYDAIAPFDTLDSINDHIRNSEGGGFYLTPWNNKLQSPAQRGLIQAGKSGECDL